MNQKQNDISWEDFLKIAGGHTAFQLLWGGIELGLFDKLSVRTDQTLESIAKEMGIEIYPARVLLIGLTSLGLIRLDNGLYRNSQLAEARLVRGKPGTVVPILGWQAHIVYPGMIDFVASLKANKNVGLSRFKGNETNLYDRLAHDPHLQTIFQDSMSGLSKFANELLPKVLDFSRFKHVVDAGGGDGTNALEIARAFPGVKTSVFDSSSVCELARQNIAKAKMASQVGTWEGDFFHKPFPPHTDCILFCHILTIWSIGKIEILLKRAYEALPVGGSVIIFNMMGGDDDQGPISTALGSPYFLAIATGEGMLHPWKDYESVLKKNGFKQILRLKDGLPLDHGILVATK
ncbi:MAG: hypothetical protein JNM39_07890 [Bdellovibrionaceae bacterium]|nr:hypothetical protein [Pseudobdellovibrionaceae bacterium]